jgi:hypothetical protein
MIVVDTNIYKSVVVLNEEESPILISEGDKIQFDLESGEVKKGQLQKLQGKDDKLKLTILPEGKECQEIWSVLVMVDGSLKTINEDEND